VINDVFLKREDVSQSSLIFTRTRRRWSTWRHRNHLI